MSSDPIKRRVVSPSGTVVSQKDGEIVIERPRAEAPPRGHEPSPLARELLRAESMLDFDTMETLTLEILARLAKSPESLSTEERAELSECLRKVANAARISDKPSAAGVALRILGLGLPALVDALVENDRERLQRLALEASVRAHGAADSGVLTDGDLSNNMNLFVGQPLVGTTSKLAAAFVDVFQPVSDAVATRHTAKSDVVDTFDFERSVGVLLVDKRSRRLVSCDEGGSFCLLSVDGRPVFRGADGNLWFEHDDAAPTRVPADALSRAVRTPLDELQVGARSRLPHDPPPRAGMAFRFNDRHGQNLVVEWWGHCESSSRLGALGFLPARKDVVLFDEAHGSKVELSAQEITNMMVFLARDNPGEQQVVGRNNRVRGALDGDEPTLFHDFVLDRIDKKLPFAVEIDAGDELWNYAVESARIEPQQTRTVGRRAVERTYVMELELTNGDKLTYRYVIREEKDGTRTSAWDKRFNAAKNEALTNDGRAPDLMRAFVGPNLPVTRLNASDYSAQRDGWSPEAVSIVADLYFASQAEGDERIYAVRKKNGDLLKLTKSEFTALTRLRRGG